MSTKEVRVSLGSKSDKEKANVFIKLLNELGVSYGVSIGSCHWSAGKDFEEYVTSVTEDIIVVIGGMSLAAPGIIASLDRNARRINRLVFAIPLDKAAQSAIEDLPPGTPVITCGLNQKDVDASITNSALCVSKLVARCNHEVGLKIMKWFTGKGKEKGIIREVKLDENGLIP